jgi:nitrogen fixation NifU-like protein
MLPDDLQELYQEVILDHSKSPRNFGQLEGANRSAEGNNPLCGDHYRIAMIVEGDTVREIRFQGAGCAISKASASILTVTLKGKTQAEARQLFDEMHQLVTQGGAQAPAPSEELNKLRVFSGVHRFPARVKCAILPWHAAMAALDRKNEPVSTEGQAS